MKVICIDGIKDGDRGLDFFNEPVVMTGDELLYELETYTVVYEVKYPGEGVYYVLTEKPYYCQYHSRRFAPTSTHSETETEVYKNLQTQTA